MSSLNHKSALDSQAQHHDVYKKNQYILKEQQYQHQTITFTQIESNISNIIQNIIDQKLKQRNTIILAKLAKLNMEKDNKKYHQKLNMNNKIEDTINMNKNKNNQQSTNNHINNINMYNDKQNNNTNMYKDTHNNNNNSIILNNNNNNNNKMINTIPQITHKLLNQFQDPLISRSISQINQHFCSQISTKVIKKLVNFFKLSKFSSKIISNVIILQNFNSSYNMSALCFWDNKKDGQKTIKKKIPSISQNYIINQNNTLKQSNIIGYQNTEGLLVVTLYICDFQKRFRNIHK